MAEIITHCEIIYQDAAQVYQNLSMNAPEKELITFWADIAGEKTQFAENFRSWAEFEMLPVVFDNPMEIINELQALYYKIQDLIEKTLTLKDISKSFLAAFKLEFYLLHPSFEILLRYVKVLSNELTPAEINPEHINRLFEKLHKYGLVTMELELLGETIRRLWEDNRRMSVQTNFDTLTKTFNRRGIFSMMKTLGHVAQRNGSNVGIMMIDLDHFKKINDTFGHLYGDKVLRLVSATIRSNIRASDVLGRFGGEEFLIFLSSVNPDFLYEVGEKIRVAVMNIKEVEMPVTISIGMSHGRISSDIDKEIETLIRRADENLYRAKRDGRNRVVNR
ncbi:MAG: GGDEF domain-containing protein [Desulfosalsimonadaceae bacterium]